MSFPPVIPQDKANHFLYGHLLACIAVWLTVAFGYHEFAPHAAFGIAALAGVVKEAHDAGGNYKATGNPFKGPHGVEGYDFLFTAAGGAPLSAILYFLF